MSDPTRPNRSDLAADPTTPQDGRAGPARSDDGDEDRRLVAERYILHARPGSVRRVPPEVQPEVTPDSEAPPPEQLIAGRYRLGPHIGGGRFGPVYRAEDTTVAERAPNRHVAVQILWSELGEHEWLVERFKSEFARLRAWQHDNIVDVLDFNRDGDRYFWTTELLDGASLRSITEELSPELLDRDEARALLHGVGEALRYAHARHKAHGAISLENVFVTSDFVVKVLDFAPISIVPPIPLYADNLKATAVTATDRDDVYGLACLAYELLSGRHPYGGSLPQEAQRCGLKPERIEVSRRAWRALRRGLSPSSEKRPATVGELLSELGVEASVRLAPSKPKTEPVDRRRGWGFIVYAPVIAILAGLAYLGYPMLFAPPSSTNRLDDAMQRAPQDAAPEPTFEAAGAEVSRADEAPAQPIPEPQAPLAEETSPGDELGADVGDTPIPRLSPGAAGDAPAIDGGIPALPATATADAAQSTEAPQGTDTTQATDAPPTDDSQAASPAAAAILPAVVESFAFTQRGVTVSEDAAIASLVIRRLGTAAGESSVTWWTIGDTAVADEDFAGFGTQVETFGDGESSRVIHVPLVVDSIAEPTERFFVGLGYDSMTDDRTETRAEIVILDDD
jgi:serine/threonine protein kinase